MTSQNPFLLVKAAEQVVPSTSDHIWSEYNLFVLPGGGKFATVRKLLGYNVLLHGLRDHPLVHAMAEWTEEIKAIADQSVLIIEEGFTTTEQSAPLLVIRGTLCALCLAAASA
jgi:hypothetical protein